MSARVSPVVELSQKRLPAGSSTTCQGFWRIAGAAYDMMAKAASAPKLGGPTVLKISLKMRLCDLATFVPPGPTWRTVPVASERGV